MTQTKLLFGSLLLRKHVKSSTVHCSNIESFLGVQPKTHCTDSAQLFGWSFPEWVSVQIGKRYATTQCTALGRNNKTDKNFLSSRSGRYESSIFPLFSLFWTSSFSREKLRFQVHLQFRLILIISQDIWHSLWIKTSCYTLLLLFIRGFTKFGIKVAWRLQFLE